MHFLWVLWVCIFLLCFLCGLSYKRSVSQPIGWSIDLLVSSVTYNSCNCYLRQGGNVFAGFCLFVCLSVCQQDNLKSYGRIFLKFWGYVGHGTNYQWFNFGRDAAGILDSGSLWNFRYHCVKGGIREPLAKRRWWCYLANSFALAEVPAGYDCFLVQKIKLVQFFETWWTLFFCMFLGCSIRLSSVCYRQ